MSAILKISDGTNTIDLLQPGVGIGLAGNGWNPAIPPIIPTNQSSPLTDGQELSSYKFANATETFQHKVNADTQDDIIELVQDTRRLLIQGINYHVVDWQNSLVYLIAKASCETNTRYALVEMFQSPNDANPYQAPFLSQDKPQMDNMSVIIERGHWLSEIPGTGICAQSNTTIDWGYQAVWDVNAVNPPVTDSADALIQAINGDLYAGLNDGTILKSIDNGLNWVLNHTFAGATATVDGMLAASDGYLYANVGDAANANRGIYRSTDNGGSWVRVYTNTNSTKAMYEASNNYLYAGDNTAVVRSVDNGATWAIVYTSTSSILSIVETGDNSILAGNSGKEIVKSTNNGASFSVIYISGGAIDSMIRLSDGTIVALDSNLGFPIFYPNALGIIASDDNGDSWALYGTPPTLSLQHAILTSTGSMYASDFNNKDAYLSVDEGLNWNVDLALAAFNFTSFLEAQDGDIFAGRFQEIQEKSLTGTTPVGISDTCSGIFIVNKDNIANLTDVKISDGGVFTNIFPFSGFPVNLLPAVPVVNDAVYFGIDTSIISNGVFNSLVFDIASPIIPSALTALYSITWEYYDGANWVTLIVTDYTLANSQFSVTGINSVVWEQPSDWASVAVDGVTAFWVRARVSTISAGTLTAPTQQNRNVYAITNSSFAFNDENVGGDIPALSHYKIFNRSDSGGKDLVKLSGTHTGANNQATLTDGGASFIDDGVLVGWYVINTTDGSQALITAITATTITGVLSGGTENDWDTNDAYQIVSGPDLWSNRVLAGLRSLSRGDNFRAFVNISDGQNVTGVTVTAGTNASFGNDTATPTGRRLTYAAAIGDTTFVDRAIISFSSDIVRDYYGRFHLFLRGRQVSGSSGDITVRAQLTTSSGGITYTTPEVIFSGTNDWELLDLDAITIPAGGRVIKPDELGDAGTLSIQAKNDSGATRDVYFYDLILLPTDEWAGDFTDQANIDDSIIGKQDNIQHFIDIDSVTNPKVIGSSLVRLNDPNKRISANYEFAANGEVILQANADQQVHIVSAHYGSNNEWISEPWVTWSVQTFKNQRYLSMRGSR